MKGLVFFHPINLLILFFPLSLMLFQNKILRVGGWISLIKYQLSPYEVELELVLSLAIWISMLIFDHHFALMLEYPWIKKYVIVKSIFWPHYWNITLYKELQTESNYGCGIKAYCTSWFFDLLHSRSKCPYLMALVFFY